MTRHAVEGHTPPAPLVKTFNVVLRRVLLSPLGRRLPWAMLLRFTGRRSGKRYSVPVTAHRDGSGLYALTPARWRLNFRGGLDVEVTLSARTTPMRGELVEDVPAVARTYLTRIAQLGLREAGRQIGLRFADGKMPTFEQVTELVEREHFAVLRLTPKP